MVLPTESLAQGLSVCEPGKRTASVLGEEEEEDAYVEGKEL